MTGIEYAVGIAGLSLSLGAAAHLLYKEYRDWCYRKEYERGRRIFENQGGLQEPPPLVALEPSGRERVVHIVKTPDSKRATITENMIPEYARVK